MKFSLSENERCRAFTIPKNSDAPQKARISVRYHIENFNSDNLPQRFLEAFTSILKRTNYYSIISHYAKICAKCARCATNCQLFLTTNDINDIPCYRSELLLRIFRRYFISSRLVSNFNTNDTYLTESVIYELADSLYNCTACGRCRLECPMGIDHSLITRLGRYILSELGIAPRALVVSTREQLDGRTGNTSGLPVPALLDTLDFLADEIKELKGIELLFPVDQEGVEYLFLPAVSDFIMEAETLMGIATVFKATGDSWTISTGNFDAINYGMFYDDYVLERVLKRIETEINRLKIKKIIIGECGHASRSAKFYYPAFCGGQNAIPVISIIEYIHQALKAGKLKLNKDVINERVTYHDPCNIARSGWIVEQPREILKAFCKDFVDMLPNRRDNYCCGGGGGTVSIDELKPYRTIIAGRIKAEQIRRTGAKYCVAPCANCKKQLRELMEEYKLDCEIVGLSDLILKTIKLD